MEFEPRVSYLLVGGFGGIGSSLAVWMAENGAHYLCIMSRSGPGTSEAKKALKNVEAMGCIVQVMLCDVGDPEAVKLAIESAEIPIRGVIHAAMTLKVGFSIVCVILLSEYVAKSSTGQSTGTYEL